MPKKATRKKITITIEKELKAWLDKNVTNKSGFINKLVESAKQQIQPAIITISSIEDWDGGDLNSGHWLPKPRG